MEEDDIYESDELYIDEESSSYAEDSTEGEPDLTVGTITNFVQERFSKA